VRSFRADLDEAFEVALGRALTKEPAERFQSVAHFAQALAPFAPAELTAAHLERISSLSQHVGTSKAIPSLRTSSRDLTARPERVTHTALRRPSPTLSTQLAVGIGTLACLGIATALLVPRLSGGGASSTSSRANGAVAAPSAVVAEPTAVLPSVVAPAAPPPRTTGGEERATPAASSPAPGVVRKPALAHAPAPLPVNQTPPRPAASAVKTAGSSAADGVRKPENLIDNDPYRKSQPKLEDNPFK
jgi:hypothetical protein